MLSFILTILLIILLMNLFGRIAFRWFIKRQLKKFKKHSEHNNMQRQGDILITQQNKAKKNIPDDVGEYVDFEELK